MGFVGGLLGGGSGMGFEAERAATTGQAEQLYKQQQQQLAQQQAFTQALQAQSPQAIAAQQQILGQLQQQAQGMGPSVASRQLASATGENIAQTGALMGAQRGVSADPGAMAQRAAQMGAKTQQQAAGQAAALRAQEQLQAQQAATGLAGQQIGQIAGAQQMGMAGTAAAQQNVLDAIAKRNQTQMEIEKQKSSQQGGMLGGLLGVAGTVMGGPIGGAIGKMAGSAIGAKAEGGLVEKPYAVGGYVDQLKMADGGIVPAMVSPGERYLPPSEVEKVKEGKKEPIKAGEKIPGKAKVAGDSYANDTVKKNLKEGGIVIPKSVLESPNAEAQAQKFVQAVLAKQALKRK